MGGKRGENGGKRGIRGKTGGMGGTGDNGEKVRGNAGGTGDKRGKAEGKRGADGGNRGNTGAGCSTGCTIMLEQSWMEQQPSSPLLWTLPSLVAVLCVWSSGVCFRVIPNPRHTWRGAPPS